MNLMIVKHFMSLIWIVFCSIQTRGNLFLLDIFFYLMYCFNLNKLIFKNFDLSLYYKLLLLYDVNL